MHKRFGDSTALVRVEQVRVPDEEQKLASPIPLSCCYGTGSVGKFLNPITDRRMDQHPAS